MITPLLDYSKLPSVQVPNKIKHALFSRRDGGLEIIDNEGKPIKIGKDNLTLTKIDTFDFFSLSNNEIIELIKSHSNIDITTKTGLDLFNEHFQTALGMYYDTRARAIFEKRWGVGIQEIREFYPFTSMESIIKFLRLPEGNTGVGKIACFISKISYAVSDIFNTFGYNTLITQERNLYNKIEGPLNISQASSDEGEYIGNIGGIGFILHGRPKSLRSMTEKLITNQSYNTADEIYDGIGYTFEVDGSDKDLLTLMQMVYNVINAVGGSINEYDNKGVELPDETNKFKFDDEFLHFLFSGNFNSRSGKKPGTSHGYKEIKIQGEIGGISFEIKFTRKGNENQDGINLQSIYEYLNKHVENVIRNGGLGYITSDEIGILVSDFFDRLDMNLQNNPEKRGTKKEVYLKELWNDLQNNLTDKNGKSFIDKKVKYENQSRSEIKLLNYLKTGLRKYYENQLELVTIKGIQEEVFTSKRGFELSHPNNLSDEGIYPNMEKTSENFRKLKDKRKKS